jgi:hypothetical protein
MTDKTTTPPVETPAAPKGEKIVTSKVAVDFPALNWAIAAGEEKALPSDADAQAVILSNPYIALKK